MSVGVQRVNGLKFLRGDHYLWPDPNKRNRILAQFTVSSIFIAEIMRCWLHGDKLSWRRKHFKLITYISKFLGSKNVKSNLLGVELKEMLIIDQFKVLAQALALTTIHFINYQSPMPGLMPVMFMFRHHLILSLWMID